MVVDDDFLLLFNAHHDVIDFTMPPEDYAVEWEVVLDTSQPTPAEHRTWEALSVNPVPGRTVVVLRSSATTEEPSPASPPR